ncbi:MAG: ABC transporter substrate-binding protein [Spirochaetaceae bacterium]|nr:ABC transporter substrate-binding protein [Spirochaetaceae bacterium]
MKRLIIVPILFSIIILAVHSRGTGDIPVSEEVIVHLVVPNGATLVPIALMDEDSIEPGYNVELEIIKSSDLLAARLISGEADFAVIPSNLAAIMANKGTGIRIVGPVIWGLSYVVTSENLNSWEDLRGKQVPMIGRGLTPDITFRHLLEVNGLNPDVDLEIIYVSAAVELVPTFLTGRSTVSMMPEPMITTVMSKKPDSRILIDIQEEWRKLYGSSYPQASLVVSGAFADKHPDFTGDFIRAFDFAVKDAIANPDEAGAAVSMLVPELNADIIADAIPRMNLGFVPATEARDALENYFRVLEDFNPVTIGGKLPTDDFYLR